MKKVTDDCNFIVKKVSLLSLFEIKVRHQNSTFRVSLCLILLVHEMGRFNYLKI